MSYPGIGSHDVDDADNKFFAGLDYVNFDQVRAIGNLLHQRLPSASSPSRHSFARTACH